MTIMRRVGLLVLATMAPTLVGAGSSAAESAMQSARRQCCTQLSGIWKEGAANGGGYGAAGGFCYGVDRNLDGFYRCVQQKASAPARKK